MRVLDVDVSTELLRSWRGWLAPDPQPFFLTDPTDLGLTASTDRTMPPELRDTYRLWSVDKVLATVWLTHTEFNALARPTRSQLVREQLRNGRGSVPTVRAWADLPDPAVLR